MVTLRLLASALKRNELRQEYTFTVRRSWVVGAETQGIMREGQAMRNLCISIFVLASSVALADTSTQWPEEIKNNSDVDTQVIAQINPADWGACVYPYQQISLCINTTKSRCETYYKGMWYQGESCSDLRVPTKKKP